MLLSVCCLVTWECLLDLGRLLALRVVDDAWLECLDKVPASRSGEAGRRDTDFAGLLAMRLAYEVALSNHFDFHVDWNSVAVYHATIVRQSDQASDEDLLRYALLKASEIAFRKRLLSGLTSSQQWRSHAKK